MKFELEDMLPQSEESVAMIAAVNDSDASIESLYKELNDTAEMMDAYQAVLKKIDDKSVDLKAFKTIREASVEGFISTDPRETMTVAIEGLGQKFVEICKKIWEKIKQFFQDLHRVIFKKMQSTAYVGESETIRQTAHFSDAEMKKLSERLSKEKIASPKFVRHVSANIYDVYSAIETAADSLSEIVSSYDAYTNLDRLDSTLRQALMRFSRAVMWMDGVGGKLTVSGGKIVFRPEDKTDTESPKLSLGDLTTYINNLDDCCNLFRKKGSIVSGHDRFMKICEELINVRIPKKLSEIKDDDTKKAEKISVLNRIATSMQSLATGYGAIEAAVTRATFGTHSILAKHVREIISERVIAKQ